MQEKGLIAKTGNFRAELRSLELWGLNREEVKVYSIFSKAAAFQAAASSLLQNIRTASSQEKHLQRFNLGKSGLSSRDQTLRFEFNLSSRESRSFSLSRRSFIRISDAESYSRNAGILRASLLRFRSWSNCLSLFQIRESLLQTHKSDSRVSASDSEVSAESKKLQRFNHSTSETKAAFLLLQKDQKRKSKAAFQLAEAAPEMTRSNPSKSSVKRCSSSSFQTQQNAADQSQLQFNFRFKYSAVQ